jgi:hypothetical protein
MDLPHFEMKHRTIRPVFKPFINKYNFSDFIVKHTNKECVELCEDMHEITFDVNGIRQFESNFVTDIYGHPFSWMFHNDMLNIWDAVGSDLVAKANFVDGDEKGRQSAINKVIERMEDYTKGYIHCSDCDTKIKRHGEVGGRYFAGVYCQKCWDGKWKAIEAKENYN